MGNILLSKRDNESAFEYHKRIIDGKLKDKTLSDIDYSELAQAAYGKEYSSDVARRMFYGSRFTLDLLEKEKEKQLAISGASKRVMNEIAMQKAELKKQQQRFYDQRREYNKIVVSDGRQEHLYEYISEVARNISEEINGMFDCKADDLIYDDNNDAVLVLSDWHYGMVTDNIFNKYDTDICKERVKKAVEEAIRRITLHKCNNLHVIVLGDLIHGAIHTSARVASEELVCDQIIHVSEILTQAVMTLRQYVNKTFIHMTYGNHARTVQDKRDSIHRDNLERLIPWWLIQRLKDFDDVTVKNDYDNEFIITDVLGHTICASHGDLDSVKASPKTLSTLFMKKYGKDIEYILLGDKHHRESFEEMGITSVICGSLCGTDDYANEKRLYSSPSQMLLIVNKDCGVDAEYTIRC